jgi:hypothetical protein
MAAPQQNAETAAVAIGERAAVFAFCGWLSGRKQTSGPFGAEFDAGEPRGVGRPLF